MLPRRQGQASKRSSTVGSRTAMMFVIIVMKPAPVVRILEKADS